MEISINFRIFVSVNQKVNMDSCRNHFYTEKGRIDGSSILLAADNYRLRCRVEVLEEEGRSLRAENRELRERLSKYEDSLPPKNSENSSVPPSKERMGDEVKRRTKSLRVKSGKKPGGQHGHDGVTRKMSDTPDEIETIQANYCNKCGRDLSDIKGEEDYCEECVGFQIKPIIRRRVFISKTCSCGCCNKAEYSKRKNPVYLSTEVKALSVYLNVVMCMPYNRIKSLFHDLMNLDISEGSIRNFIAQAGTNADEICERISRELAKSPVAGADESGFYVNGKLHWAWILQNPKYTLTWIAKGRAAKEMENRFGTDALKDMVLVTDRHNAYFTMDVRNHQICLAHILRNLNYLNELDQTQNWSSRLQELLRKAIHWRSLNPDLPTDTSTWNESLDRLLNEDISKLKKPFRQLRNSLKKYRDHVFLFLKDPRVPSHNNDSEGGIRILKVKQKRSGGFRSDGGAADFMAIHSVTDTAKKNNYSKWDAILALL